jgi:hypothetical protein
VVRANTKAVILRAVDDLLWELHRGTDGWAAVVDGRIVAEVVPYGRGAPYWVGWVGGSERVKGRYATRQQAQKAVEVALWGERSAS